MNINKTKFEGLVEIIPEIFSDNRGSLFENYNFDKLKNFGVPEKFPLEFQSISKGGVIRGMHFQKHPYAQGKLVRVIKGAALDIVIDLKKESPTFGKWFSTILSDENKKILWIPVGFAHGFLALEDDTVMLYKLTSSYNKESEGGIIWNDPDININWQLEKFGIGSIVVSERDMKHPKLKDNEYFF